MHGSPMNVRSSSSMRPTATSSVQPRVLGHKRRRCATFSKAVREQEETNSSNDSESCCTTSGESSGDESSLEDLEDEEEVLTLAKRRRRADLDGLKKSVRRMEAQVVDASAQLRDLAAIVAQAVARRQQQQSRF